MGNKSFSPRVRHQISLSGVEEKENQSFVFSGDREIPTRGSTVPVGKRLHRVSHWNGGPEGWDFPVPLCTNDQFYFSHI